MRRRAVWTKALAEIPEEGRPIGLDRGDGGPGVARALRVAAVQIESQHGSLEANHAHAELSVEEAAREGAQLIVPPGLFATGYTPNRTIWDCSELENGPTVRWLSRISPRLGVYLGAGLVETDGLGFFNVYVITTPEGRVAGRAVRNNPEAHCFRCGRGSHHILETPLG